MKKIYHKARQTASDLPTCDFVQECTAHNLACSFPTPSARDAWPEVSACDLQVVKEQYDLLQLKQQYIEKCAEIIGWAAPLSAWTLSRRIRQNARDPWRRAVVTVQGQVE